MQDWTGLIGWMFANPYARLFLVATLLTAVLFARPLADRIRWSRPGTFITICGVGGALSVTLVNRIGVWDIGWTPESVSSCMSALSRSWTSPEAFLNLCLLVPLGGGLALATRTLSTPIAAVAVMAVSIEIVQAAIGLGACQRGDMARNTIGGIAAALATITAIRLAERSVGQSHVVPALPLSDPGQPRRRRFSAVPDDPFFDGRDGEAVAEWLKPPPEPPAH